MIEQTDRQTDQEPARAHVLQAKLSWSFCLHDL